MADMVLASEFILRLPQVKERVGLSRSTIYELQARGKFPSSISLGGRSVGWLKREVDDWIIDRINESRSGE